MISVVLPTYNREHFLREAVGSVLEQTYADWELIVVDDGSTDGTGEFLRGVADPRLLVVTHERCGSPARLRNAGISRAARPYLAFLDSDDVWAPTKLAVQLAALRAAPECRWCMARFERIDDRGRPLPHPPTWEWRPFRGWMLGRILRDEVVVALPGVLAEKALVAEVGGFDESLPLCSDYDLWVRLAHRAQAVAIATPLVKVRTHATNHTRGRDVEAHELLGRVYQKLLRDVADEKLRTLTRHRHARSLISLADHRRTAGQYRSALRALRDALRLRGVHRAWCLSLAKALLRPMIPDRAMSRYYHWRRSRTG
jgi:glycosyltransferase involved in cell wall biosynthesis